MPHFHITGPDDMPLTPEPFDSIAAAAAYIPAWCANYQRQGYYRDASRNTIPVIDLPRFCVVVPEDPEDLETIEPWFRHLIGHYQLNFHPDTPFTDYRMPDGVPVFPRPIALRLDDILDEAYRAHGGKLYEIALPILCEALQPGAVLP